MQAYLTALANVYDPHSDYFNKSQADNFAIGMNLQLFGIGAELYSDEGYCTIRRVTPNGPAEKSRKLKAKDRIVAVAPSGGSGRSTPPRTPSMDRTKRRRRQRPGRRSGAPRPGA